MDFFYSRRLTDRIVSAFRTACDEDDLETAARLLVILEIAILKTKTDSTLNRRKSLQVLTDAHERLWHLRRQAGLPEDPAPTVSSSAKPPHGGQVPGGPAHHPV